MTADLNKKTQRTFQCKDALWQKFEQMARELECSVDYLVNDAMKQYARQRGYGAAAGSPSIPPPMAPPPPSSGPPPTPSSGVAAAPPPAAAKLAPPPPAPAKRAAPGPPAPSHGHAGLPPLHTHPASAQASPHWLQDLWTVLRNRDVWPGFWALFGVGGGMMAFAGLWGVPLLRDSFGLARSEAALYTTAALAA
ncbi:MAG TPA: hypothetical protein VJN18_21385, partial [Polyangiaceae bacterium]|nr:hypothetical protein [Polyangiaceae bacterium]